MNSVNLCATHLRPPASGFRFAPSLSRFATHSSSSSGAPLRGAATRGCMPCFDARTRAAADVGCVLVFVGERLRRHGRVARPP